jgi:hypothetical protein
VGLLLFLLLRFTLGEKPEESGDGVLFTEAPFHLEDPPQKVNISSNSSEVPTSVPLEPEVVANATSTTPEVLLIVSSSTSTTDLPSTPTTPTKVETPATISLYPDYPNVPPSLYSHISTMISKLSLTYLNILISIIIFLCRECRAV